MRFRVNYFRILSYENCFREIKGQTSSSFFSAKLLRHLNNTQFCKTIWNIFLCELLLTSSQRRIVGGFEFSIFFGVQNIKLDFHFL